MVHMLKTYFDSAYYRYDEDGASMVEYGLLVALIAIVVAVVAVTLGDNIATAFQDSADCVADPTDC